MNKKTTDVVTYLGPIGFIISFLLGTKEESRFHLNQSLVLILSSAILAALEELLSHIPLVGGILELIFGLAGLGVFILWIMGIASAGKGQEKPIPVLGGISLLK